MAAPIMNPGRISTLIVSVIERTVHIPCHFERDRHVSLFVDRIASWARHGCRVADLCARVGRERHRRSSGRMGAAGSAGTGGASSAGHAPPSFRGALFGSGVGAPDPVAAASQQAQAAIAACGAEIAPCVAEALETYAKALDAIVPDLPSRLARCRRLSAGRLTGSRRAHQRTNRRSGRASHWRGQQDYRAAQGRKSRRGASRRSGGPRRRSNARSRRGEAATRIEPVSAAGEDERAARTPIVATRVEASCRAPLTQRALSQPARKGQ